MSAVFESFDDLAEHLASIDPRWVALALAFQLGNLGLRAVAWRAVIAAAYPLQRIRLRDVGAAYAAGVALNAYVPARGGEALKITLLRLRIHGSSVPTLAATSSVILLFDAAMGVGFLGLAWSLGIVPAIGAPSLELVAAVAAAAVVGVFALSRAPRLRARFKQGTAILATPRLYFREVVPAQLGAWACRVGVVFALLAAFGLPATVPLAGLVVVAGGLSTLVPATPGGAGTQQVLVVYALQQTAAAASSLSFSIGMQVGVTAVNTLVGLAGLALLAGAVRPSALRATVRAAREPSI